MFYYLLACTIILIYLYGYRIFARIRYRHIPGPPPQWLIGNLAGIKHLSKAQTEWAKIYGPVFKIFVGGSVMFSVNDPELCRKLLMKCHHRSLDDIAGPIARKFRKFCIEQLFFTKGKKFRSFKSAWQVAFNQGSIHNYFPLMQQHADQFCNVITEKAKNNDVFNIHKNIEKMTLEVVASTAFGIQLGLLSKNQKSDYEIQAINLLDHLRIIMQLAGSISITPWTIMNFLFPEFCFLWGELSYRIPLSKIEKADNVATEGMVQATRTIVKHERIRMSQNSNSNSNSNLNFSNANSNFKNVIDPGSFIVKLMKTKDQDTGQVLTDDQVAAQVQNFMLAGYDTTANALAFSIHLLCLNPSKKQKLFKELDQFCDDDSPSFIYQTLDKCVYLEAVIKETLRLFPTGAGGCVRQCTDNIKLSKHTFSAKSNFLVNIYGIHRDPTIWPKPEQFIPERFLEGEEEYVFDKIHPFAYIPFGGGTRMCIGHRYAMQELKLIIFKLFKNFDFELQPGQEKMESTVALTLSPKHGVFVRALKR